MKKNFVSIMLVLAVTIFLMPTKVRAQSKTRTPKINYTTVYKTVLSLESVDFGVINTYRDGIWKVYNSEKGGSVVPGLSLSYRSSGLRMTCETEIPSGDYYLTFTENNLAESDRVKVTVSEHVHDWMKEWSMDSKQHWHDCSDADCPVTNIRDKDSCFNHSPEWETIVKPTYKSKGKERLACPGCGRFYEERDIPELIMPDYFTVTIIDLKDDSSIQQHIPTTKEPCFAVPTDGVYVDSNTKQVEGIIPLVSDITIYKLVAESFAGDCVSKGYTVYSGTLKDVPRTLTFEDCDFIHLGFEYGAPGDHTQIYFLKLPSCRLRIHIPTEEGLYKMCEMYNRGVGREGVGERGLAFSFLNDAENVISSFVYYGIYQSYNSGIQCDQIDENGNLIFSDEEAWGKTYDLDFDSSIDIEVTYKSMLNFVEILEDKTVSPIIVYNDYGNHTYSTEWTNSDTHHWHECTMENCPITQDNLKKDYEAHVYDDEGDVTCNTCSYERKLIAPTVINQPLSQNVIENKDATFTVTALGSPTLNYQWWLLESDRWVEIPGATGASYTVKNVKNSEDGMKYRCSISNSVGTVISNEVVLNVSKVSPFEYTILDGVKRSWSDTNRDAVGFKVNGEFSKFTNIQVDDKLVNTNDFTIESLLEGTAVELKQPYLHTLSAGEHKICINFTDGYAETTFTIIQTTNSDATIKSDTPQTNDNSTIILWMGAILLAGFMASMTWYKKRKI